MCSRLLASARRGLCAAAGTALAQEGAVGNEFFVVLEGDVEVRHGDQVIAIRGPGSHVGEIALLAHRRRTATLVTKTAVSARVATQREFSGLCSAVPEISQRLHVSMAERLAA